MDSAHTASGRRRGAPPAGQRLTREVVVARAGQMIAEHGLTTFSVRGLAEALGVAPNAVYNHVRNRDDVLDAVTDQMVESIQFPADDQPWPDWVRTTAVTLRAQLSQHPGLTELILARAGSTARGPRVLNRFLDRLVADGLDRAVAHLIWHAVLTVVVGSLWQDRARAADRDATFHVVLDVTMIGLLSAAEQPPSPSVMALLHAHQLSGD
jgi:TetR/AcrR family tetracycline transcriptional repressor